MERPPLSVLRQSEKALGRPSCRGPHTCRCRCSTMPPSAPWSPTAHAFAHHQFSHVTNFWKQGRQASFRMEVLPDGKAELSLTFQLPPATEEVPPPFPVHPAAEVVPPPPHVLPQSHKVGHYASLLKSVSNACRLFQPYKVQKSAPYLTLQMTLLPQTSLLCHKGSEKTFKLGRRRYSEVALSMRTPLLFCPPA